MCQVITKIGVLDYKYDLTNKYKDVIFKINYLLVTTFMNSSNSYIVLKNLYTYKLVIPFSLTFLGGPICQEVQLENVPSLI
jgi:hypothetical protein